MSGEELRAALERVRATDDQRIFVDGNNEEWVCFPSLVAALADPSTPEPLEVCPRCGRFSSHDHDVAPSTPEPSGRRTLFPPPPAVSPEALDEYLTDVRIAQVDRAAPSTPEPSGLTAQSREAAVRAVHDWFCGESVEHGDRRRPRSGWACERGADAVLARLAESR